MNPDVINAVKQTRISIQSSSEIVQLESPLLSKHLSIEYVQRMEKSMLVS